MTATFVDLAKGGEIRYPMSLRKKLSTRRCQVSMRRRVRSPKSTEFQVAIFPYSGSENVS